MKKRIKKRIVVMVVALTLLSSSLTAFAASCLDVRDYGHHRYNNRILGWRVANQEVLGAANDGSHRIVVRVTEKEYGICVCGERGDTGAEYVYEKLVDLP